MKIDDLIKDIKDITEMRAFCEAQYRTILQLNKRLKATEEERDQARKLLETTAPLVNEEAENLSKKKGLLTPDEEEICREQLRMLNETSKRGPLSFEDSKKVDLFAKLLLQVRESRKKSGPELENQETGDLLRLVESKDE